VSAPVAVPAPVVVPAPAGVVAPVNVHAVDRTNWRYDELVRGYTATIRLVSLHDILLRLGFEFSSTSNASPFTGRTGLTMKMTALQGVLTAIGVSWRGLRDSFGEDQVNHAALENIQLSQLGMSRAQHVQLFSFVMRLGNACFNLGRMKEIELFQAQENLKAVEHERRQMITGPDALPDAVNWLHSIPRAPSTWSRVARHNVWVVTDGTRSERLTNPNHSKVWFLQAVTPAHSRRVVLYDASIVAQVLLGGQFVNADQLLLYCVESGIRVNAPAPAVVVDEKEIAAEREERRRVLNGYCLEVRKTGYVAHPSEHHTAEARRRTISNDRAVSRAALMHGDFVWRVMAEHSYTELATEAPSRDALVLGLGAVFRVGHGRSQLTLVDDALPLQVEWYILGGWTEPVPGAQRRLKAHTYYPDHAVWRSLATAGWDARKEAIYANFRQRYQQANSKDEPIGSTMWKKRLSTMNSVAYRLAKGCDVFAGEFLASRHGQSYVRLT
jgi:hypothetical protein